MLKEFREFATRGNVLEVATGLVLGLSFTAIVNSFVNDILMPPLGLLLGGADFKDLFLVLKPGDPVGPYLTLLEAQEAGAVTMNYGVLVNSVLSFILIAFALFILIKGMNSLYKTGKKAE
jgi:large conductance mechanosensitive channel